MHKTNRNNIQLFLDKVCGQQVSVTKINFTSGINMTKLALNEACLYVYMHYLHI